MVALLSGMKLSYQHLVWSFVGPKLLGSRPQLSSVCTARGAGEDEIQLRCGRRALCRLTAQPAPPVGGRRRRLPSASG